MAGKNRKVKAGEWLGKIAHDEKFTDSGKAIWGDANNAKVHKTNPSGNLLCEHVELYIPEKKKKEESGAVDAKHKFVVPKPKALLRIVVIDMDGEPVENEPYQLVVDLEGFVGKTYGGPPMSNAKGQWDKGLIQHEIKVTAENGMLMLPGRGAVFTLKIGHLVEIVPGHTAYGCANKGVQARLNNLGFGSGSVDGAVGPKTKAAVHAFQADMAKNKASLGYDSGTADGIPGPITKNALKRRHGGC